MYVLSVDLQLENPASMTVDQILKAALEARFDDIIVWLAKRNSINPYTYEGGYSQWWGAGSVTIDNLGIKFTVKLSATKTTVVLE